MSIIHIPFYPSDWLSGTLGLSDAEKGVYITLIARMYEMAGPIERDDDRLFRVCGCKSKASFVKSLEYLISEGKIIVTDDGLFNEKAAKVIKETTEKSSKAKSAAQSRWNRKSNKNKGRTDANASSEHMPQPCQLKPELELKKEDTDVSLSASPDPVHANDLSEAVAIYNTAAAHAGWPKVEKMTPQRSRSLKARMKDCGGLEGWREALRKAYASNFCREEWRGFNFDSLISQQKFTSLMEGKYDNRNHHNAGASQGRQNRPDPALEQIARLAGIGTTPGYGGR